MNNDWNMAIFIAELLGVILSGLALIGGIGKLFVIIFSKLKEHDTELAEHEKTQAKTAELLERTALTVSALEERTKHL